MGIVKEFREFASKGNVLDLAVGLMLGAAFGAVVKSFVDDVVMPVVGLALGGMDFAELYVVLREPTAELSGPATLQAMREAGAVVVAYGQFVNVAFAFLILAWVVFLIVRAANRMRRPASKPEERTCPECLTAIPPKARRCKACTAVLS